eukprot:759359-Hanusia_phi.AAC.2
MYPTTPGRTIHLTTPVCPTTPSSQHEYPIFVHSLPTPNLYGPLVENDLLGLYPPLSPKPSAGKVPYPANSSTTPYPSYSNKVFTIYDEDRC